MRYILMSLAALALVGCGGGTTYEAGSNATPEIPTDTGAYIVQSSQGSTSVMQYTQLNDGSILVTCGDGDGYNCQVFVAEEVTTSGSDGASASGGCSNSQGGC